MIKGTIGVPVKITATGTKIDWPKPTDPGIILRVALDRKSASFTPTEKKIYTIIVIEDGKQRKVEVDCRDLQPTPEPNPQPEPTPTGKVLYDMNRDIDFSKDLKFDEYRGPTGIRIHTEASGSPRGYIIAATKELVLEHDGKYGRFYFEVPNYNGVLEGEFKLQDCDQNASFKTRSRHQYRDEKDSKAPDSQVQGGLGCAYHCGTVENKIEVVHGGASACSQSKTLPTKLVANRYYKFRFTYYDKDGKIYEKDELDYGNGFQTLAEYNCTAPSQFFNKAEFLQWSEFWIRLNDVNGGRLSVRNVRLTAI